MQELTVPQAFGSDAKIHPEPYAKYPDDERRTNSRARVREWLEEGQLTESSVHQRLTDRLSEDFKRRGEMDVLEKTFAGLKGSKPENIDPSSLATFLLTPYLKSASYPVQSLEHGVSLLAKLLTYYANFPFPSPSNPTIHLAALIRLTAILHKHRSYRFNTWSQSSGYWGPHFGMISTVRPTTKSDTYRRLFRALAIPYASEIEEATKVTQVPVVCFSYSEEISPSVGRDSEWPEVQEHLVRSLEDERYVDVKDVLALVPPGAEDRKVAVPFRESYDVAVSALPGYEQDLDRLVVRPGDVAEVLALVDVVDYVRAGKNVNVDEIRAEAKKIYNRMVAGKDGNISFSMFEAKGESIAQRVLDVMSDLVEQVFKHSDIAK